MTTETRQARYREELLDRILPWWESHAIVPAGGVLTCFSNDGTLLSTDRYTWSQGRWAWLCAELSEAGAAGALPLAAEDWRERAVRTARLLEGTIVDDGTAVAFVTDEEARHLPADEAGSVAVSVFADLFAALGLTGAAAVVGPTSPAETAEGDRWTTAASALLVSAARRIRDGSAPSAPYSVPRDVTDLGRTMLLTSVATEVHRRTGSLESRAIVEEGVHRIVGPGGQWDRDRCWEYRPRASSDLDTLVARHLNPGHVLEMAWMLLDAADHVPGLSTPLPDWLPETVLRTLELGWDDEHGGLLRYVDHEGGPPRGRTLGGAYEELVRDTWSTKLWWVHVEALLAAETFAARTGDPRFERWAERLAEYTLATFPDRSDGGDGGDGRSDGRSGTAARGREWQQIRSRDGAPLERVVALPVKDPFHVPRALLRLIGAHERTTTS
ncbi:AGE family epimerase/isomerase [Frigoribacterium sp. 2-23]|uniref:AGE family epimerase/isomerase n=1 Tax=Frigoribacterium sp. 2-23 TaxID=3415006 RepID=UPI003C6EDD20